MPPPILRVLFALAFAVLTVLSLPPLAGAAAPHEPATLLVKFANRAAADAAVQAHGDVRVGRTLHGVDIVRLGDGALLQRRLAAYRSHPEVLFAELNYLATTQLAAPNDPSFGSQWALAKIRAVDAWSIFPGSYAATGGAVMAVVDTGVQASHPDLGGRVLTGQGANCVTSTSACVAGPAGDDNGHGTHVAGIAAAATNNGAGVAGMAYGSPIIPVKVLSASGSGTYASIANGILWAAQKGARVINLSLGGSSFSQALCDAVATAGSSYGALVVAAAGNSSTTTPFYPAACAGSVGVAASTPSDTGASFSNFGSPNVFVAAPGASILSTYNNGGYATMSGTSMASPYAAGLAALLFGQQSGRTSKAVKMILATTSAKVGGGYGADPYGTCACSWSSTFGYGRIDAYAALSSAALIPAASFTLAASPSSRTIAPGGSAAYSVGITATGGFAGSVSFSASGLPAGATASFSPTASTSSSALTVQTNSSTPTGTFTLTVTGTSGSLVRTTTVTLVVDSGGSFSLSASPSTRTVVAGGSTTYDVMAMLSPGWAYHVELSVSGLPSGTSGSFSSVRTSGPSVLTVRTSVVTPAGSHPLTITGASNGMTRTMTVTLVVNAAAPADFSLTVTPSSPWLYRGETVTLTVQVAPSNGFSGSVSLSTQNMPSGVSGSFSPNPTGTSSTLTLRADAIGKYGVYTVTISGTSGSLARAATITLTVTHR